MEECASCYITLVIFAVFLVTSLVVLGLWKFKLSLPDATVGIEMGGQTVETTASTNVVSTLNIGNTDRFHAAIEILEHGHHHLGSL